MTTAQNTNPHTIIGRLVGTRMVPVAKFISLADTDIPGSTEVMRKVDPKHVRILRGSLESVAPSNWTPLDVVEAEDNFIVLNGYHRWNVVTGMTDIEPLYFPIDATGTPTPDSQPITEVPVNVWEYDNDLDMLKDAFNFNALNGKALDAGSRTRFGVMLYLRLKGTPEEITQAEAARQAGIARGTLNPAILKEEKRLARESTVTELPASEEDVTSTASAKAELTVGEKSIKKAEAFIAGLDNLYDEDRDAFYQVVTLLTPVVVTNLQDMHLDKSDSEYADTVKAALQIKAEDLKPENVGYVTRLATVLTLVVKKATQKVAVKAVKKPAKAEKFTQSTVDEQITKASSTTPKA